MKLLITAGWVGRYLEEFKEEFPSVTFVTGDTPEELIAEAADADVIFGPVSSDIFVAAKQAKWIQSASAGVEWMQRVPELADSDVIVTNTRGAHASTIAEHTIGMLVYLARNFDELHENQKQHIWKGPRARPNVGLMGLTMGIIGLGNIGRAIAERAQAFGMKITAVDAHEVPKSDHVAKLGQLDAMPDLLKTSDIVVVTVPITPETRGMIGPDELKLLQASAFLLVVSRGGIIDEPTLIQMLQDGELAAAAIDVAATEPLPENDPLWDAPNLFITPHCSPSSEQTHANVTARLKENLTRYLAGEELTNQVSKKLGY